MAKDILLISEESGFAMRSLINSLEDNGLTADHIHPSDLSRLIERNIDTPGILLLFINGSLNSSQAFLNDIKSLCRQNRKKMCVVGTAEDSGRLRESLLPGQVTCEVERPFALPVLIGKLRELTGKTGSVERRQILLVDDDVMFLKMMQKWLSAKYDVFLTKSGDQALTFLQRRVPDLMLLDYNMPLMSGPQVLKAVREGERCPSLPVIFLTGRTDKETVSEVMAMDIQGYILKASAQADILKAIDDFFAKI